MPGAIDVPDFVPQPLLKHHDASVLDLAFVIDCTGSMGSYIDQARKKMQSIVEEIVAKEMSDIHLALVEYRDHPPQDKTFVTRVLDFTPSLKTMQTKMNGMSAKGGGDGPEAVTDGLHEALNLKWRPRATKVCVLIADAPPHGLGDSGDAIPKGCPAGHDPMKISREMAEKNVTLYTVACGPYAEEFKDFFMAIAHVTGGQYVSLKDVALLSKVIIGGAREEMSLQQLMDEVNHEVMQEFHARGGTVDEDAMATRVETTFRKKKRTAKAMTTGTDALPDVSKRSKRIAKLESLADVRSELAKPDTSGPTPSTSSSAKRTDARKRKMEDSTSASTSSTSSAMTWGALAKVRKTKHVVFAYDSDDDVAMTRSRSRHPVTGVCAVCSAKPKAVDGKKRPRPARTPTPRPSPAAATPAMTSTATKLRRSPRKKDGISATPTLTAATTAATPTTDKSDISFSEAALVSRRQVQRLVTKSIAVNKLRIFKK